MKQMVSSKQTSPKYSLIILYGRPFFDKNFEYIQELHDLFAKRGEPFEIIISANGGGAVLQKKLPTLSLNAAEVRAYEYGSRTTQTMLLQAALKVSKGELVVATECLKKITNVSFKNLLDQLDNGADMVCPWRQHRVESRLNRLQSKLFNRLIRWLTKSKLNDNNCAIKAFKREVGEDIRLHGSFYRFLHVHAERRGFSIDEVGCEHVQMLNKTGIYSFSHYFNLFTDIGGLFFSTWFSKKPLRLFSALGLTFFLVGLLITAIVFAQKIVFGIPVGGRMALVVALLLAVVGVQIGSIGLLGELIAFVHGRSKAEYTIEKVI